MHILTKKSDLKKFEPKPQPERYLAEFSPPTKTTTTTPISSCAAFQLILAKRTTYFIHQLSHFCEMNIPFEFKKKQKFEL